MKLIRSLMILAVLGISSGALVGCDDDDVELKTPAGDVEVDR